MPTLTILFLLALPIFSLQIILMTYALLKNRQTLINRLFAGLMLALALSSSSIMIMIALPQPQIVALMLWLHIVAVCIASALIALFLLELLLPDGRFVPYLRWLVLGVTAVSLFLLVSDWFYAGQLVFAFDATHYDGEYLFLVDYLSGRWGPFIYGLNVKYPHLIFPFFIAGLLIADVLPPKRKATAVGLLVALICLYALNFVFWLLSPIVLQLLGSFSMVILATWAIRRHQVLSPVNVVVRQALDTATFGVLVFDQKWRLLESNQTAQQMLPIGLQKADTLFSLLTRLAAKARNQAGVETFAKDTAVAFVPARTLGLILPHPRFEDRVRWLYFQFAKINPDGQLAGYLCTIEDQTAVRHTQEKLEAVNKSLEKFAFQTTLFNDIIRTAISDIDLNIMLPRFADRLGDMFAADGCFITTWDEIQQKSLPAASYGPVLDTYHAVSDFPERPSITKAVLDSGQHLVVQNVTQSPFTHLHEQGGFQANALLALPLISDQQKIGAILLLFSGDHVITLEETALGHQAAIHIALAISKVLTLIAEREQRVLAETLREINLALTSTLDIKTILDLVLEQIARVLPYDTASILLLDKGKVEMARLRGFENYTRLSADQIIKNLQPLQEIATFETMLIEQRPLLVSDVSQYAAWSANPATEHIKSWIGVPLIIEGEVKALLTVDKTEPHAYQESHKETLSIFTHQLALALQRAQWYEDSQKWAHQLSTLNDLSAQMVGLVTVQALSDLVVNYLQKDFHYANVIIFMIDPENEAEMTVQSFAGIYADIIEHRPAPRISIYDGLMGLAVTRQQFMLVNDAQNHPEFYQLPGMDIQSELAVPIKAANEVLGLLNVESDQKDAFNENDVVLLTIIADQLAVALQKVRLFEITGRRAAELEVLGVISAHLRVAHTTTEMLAIILENTVDMFNAQTGVISLIDSEQNLIVSRCVYPVGSYPIGLSHQFDQGITGYVVKTGQLYISNDMKNDPKMVQFEGEGSFLEKLSQCISLPLKTETSIIGVCHIGLAEKSTISKADIQLLISIADISANALYRAQLLESLEEHVNERTQELQVAYARLKELDLLKSKFISDVTHELRTPVANLNLYLDLIKAGKPENRERYMAVIEKQTARLTQIVENTLQIPRLTSGENVDSFEMVDLDALLTTAVAAFAAKAEAKGVHLKCQIAADLPQIPGDAKQLEKAVRNVLANAINYTHAGQVSIQAALDGEPAQPALQLTFADSGMGIEDRDMPYVFDQFYRGQKVGQSNIPGMGLGLTFVKTVVELHHGRVTLESRAEEGTICTIWLPAPVRDADDQQP